ncbi:hypothetical protein PCANC_18384 [Puccinia coronata f. sp. avenae]|uniref:Retroviral polymerase SH3-like domain-containing protein n=1 Tax=Puccinia coronata f. sp. avenae TaxID=200324 RepID=A0A2N5V1M5_9BASI|nr:hypothetical protein PCANC_18384 [Puccinia coronata f. sp. avenae]
MKFKSDSFQCFKLFRASFEKSRKHSIQSLRTDNAEVPKSFWANALWHAFHSYKLVPCKTPSGFKSPVSILDQPPVDPKYLHPFGCLAWYKFPETNRKKLDQKARSSMLLSYLSDGNGFRLWDLEKRTVIKSRDVIFHDSIFPYGTELSPTPAPLLAELPWDDTLPQTPLPSVSQMADQPTAPDPILKSAQAASAWPRSSTLDHPPLNINLQPRFDRWLQASIHAATKQTPPTPSNQQLPPDPKPTGISIIKLPPLPPSPPPHVSEGAVAPSGIAPPPSSPNTAQAPPSPPRQRSGWDRIRAPVRYGN